MTYPGVLQHSGGAFAAGRVWGYGLTTAGRLPRRGGFETPIEPPQGGPKGPPKTGFALGLDPAEARFAGPKAQSAARAKARLQAGSPSES